MTISQGLSAVLYSLDPEQNKLLEVLLSITIDFYLTKVTASQPASSLTAQESGMNLATNDQISTSLATPDSKLQLQSLKLEWKRAPDVKDTGASLSIKTLTRHLN